MSIYYYLKLNEDRIELLWNDLGLLGYDFRSRIRCGKHDCQYEIEIVFDEMMSKWNGITNSCGQNKNRSKIYPSLSSPYYVGWFKRFLPTIGSIKLSFQRF